MPKITPHKGGRTVRLEARATPETKRLIDQLKQKHHISLGDLIEWAANERIKNDVKRTY